MPGTAIENHKLVFRGPAKPHPLLGADPILSEPNPLYGQWGISRPAWWHRHGHGGEQTLSDKETEVEDWGGSDKGRTEVLLLTFRLN